MANKNMVKAEDFRIVFKSDLIMSSPYAYLASLPAELKAAIAKAFMDAADQGQGRFRQAVGRQGPRCSSRSPQADYKPVVELQDVRRHLRKKKS